MCGRYASYWNASLYLIFFYRPMRIVCPHMSFGFCFCAISLLNICIHCYLNVAVSRFKPKNFGEKVEFSVQSFLDVLRLPEAMLFSCKIYCVNLKLSNDNSIFENLLQVMPYFGSKIVIFSSTIYQKKKTRPDICCVSVKVYSH